MPRSQHHQGIKTLNSPNSQSNGYQLCRGAQPGDRHKAHLLLVQASKLPGIHQADQNMVESSW